MAEAEVSSEAQSDRIPVVLYTDSFKIDGFVSAPAAGEPILKGAQGPLVVYDCKVYDRLRQDKFIFGMSRMEVTMEAVEIAMPRDSVTKEGVF